MLRMSSTLGGRWRRATDGDMINDGESVERTLISEPPFCHGSKWKRTIRIECRYIQFPFNIEIYIKDFGLKTKHGRN